MRDVTEEIRILLNRMYREANEMKATPYLIGYADAVGHIARTLGLWWDSETQVWRYARAEIGTERYRGDIHM